MGLGREVHDDIVAGHDLVDGLCVADVALDEGVSGVVRDRSEVGLDARVGQLVEDSDLRRGICTELLADEF